jgi:hypothetical protein
MTSVILHVGDWFSLSAEHMVGCDTGCARIAQSKHQQRRQDRRRRYSSSIIAPPQLITTGAMNIMS